MTQNVWSYRTDLTNDAKRQEKLVGYSVEALDGRIGKIDKASTETDRYYLVVDTGFWIFGKKRLIPAGVVQSVDHADRTVYVGMSKEQIKSAPDYDESMTSNDDTCTTTSTRVTTALGRRSGYQQYRSEGDNVVPLASFRGFGGWTCNPTSSSFSSEVVRTQTPSLWFPPLSLIERPSRGRVRQFGSAATT